MDILKKSIAPITTDAWEEINDTAKEAILSRLTARQVLKVLGPKGLDYNAVGEGRLENLKGDPNKSEVCTGTYKMKHLVEARISFEISKWELDNIERGAKDIEFDALEEAAEKLALFEENAIYNGYPEGDIVGLSEAAGHSMKFGKDGEDILKNIGEAKFALYQSYAQGPFDLVVSPEAYQKINIIYEGASLYKLIEQVIGGKIIRSEVVKGALLVPHFDDDLEFTVGQDYAVGYEGDADENVRLFITESFTLRILDEDKIVKFE